MRKKIYCIQVAIICSFLCCHFFASAQLSPKDTATVQFINSRKFFIYKVNKGETLYSISQKFKIPEEEIIEFNKDIKTDGLKNKMKLWVPAYSWLNKDTTATVTVKPSIIESVKIAVVTSLSLPKIYTGQDTSDLEEPFSREIKDNLEFVEGVFAAAESHKNKYKVHIYVIDAEDDSAKVLLKLRKHKDFNLIITNETGSILKNISSFSESYNVKLFSCGVNTYETIKNNMNAFAMMPSSASQCELAGIFSAKYFTHPDLILVRTSLTKENERSDMFVSGWKTVNDGHIKMVNYPKNGAGSVADSLIKNDQNVIFISTSNEEIVSSILNALKEKNPDYRINVIGLPTWQFFETVDQKLFDVCNVHLFSSGMIDYSLDPVTVFRKHFRDKYNTEPTDISFQGYDAFLVSDALLQQSGVSLLPEQNEQIKGIFSVYHFTRPDSQSCFENKIIHVFQPSKEGYVDLAKNIKFY